MSTSVGDTTFQLFSSRGTLSRSKIRQLYGHNTAASFSYRRDRAKKRRVFLQTYKLGTVDDDSSMPRKLKKTAVVKVKSAVVSTVLFFRRMNSLTSCTSPNTYRK